MLQIKDKNSFLIRIAVLVIISLILFLAYDLRKNIDNEIESLFVRTRGQLEPDTNIIIIHFSEEDIARIGPWPIKRNYYALLINQLTNLEVKKIGLEVFLSSRLVTQSVYDNLLLKEIEKSGNVVLSSLAGSIVERNNQFITDSLSYPSPKLLNEKLPTGHINFIQEEDYYIPLRIINYSLTERAFALQLADTEVKKDGLIVNFVSSWNKIKRYSSLEFAELVYKQSEELNFFKDKIVIIGISDPQIAISLQTPFDDDVPGLALHAFAIDNILNSRDIDGSFYNYSIVVFFIIMLGFVLFRISTKKNIIAIYLITGSILLILSFILTGLLNYKISVSFFVIPFLSLILADSAIYFVRGKELLKGALDESTALKNLLNLKENELLRLQSEIRETGKESTQLQQKIDLLQNDIKKLKGNEDDRSEAVITISNKIENFYGMIYSSRLMAQVVELVKKAAPTDSTILITGESGTGKELVAKAIHASSKRNENNFISVNCAALTDSLLESELFGYEKGAFTHAISDRLGRFEQADQGTIFLDEIGETTENFQVKILRVLQSGEIEKVGSTKPKFVDVRIVAATNKNLSELVKEKKFREDLYYRLNVINIELPPLKERKEDINALAKSFIDAEAEGMHISISALQALNEYNWKGNVRELESVMKRAIIFAKSENRKLLQLKDLPEEIVKESSYNFDDIVLESLRSKKFSHSSIVETAKELGNVNRTLISENLRGTLFKSLVESGFDIDKAVKKISESDDEEINERVRTKLRKFIDNIESDVIKFGEKNFESVKNKFTSKYKNLPSKFHTYLDKVIQNTIEHKL
ncbi:MAG: sigma 54-interacting transcriptional regulator [bacterium]|nr:sigma 54-interacting transcriptional regulator [bacterium]